MPELSAPRPMAHSRAAFDQFRKHRWQTIAGQFVAGPALVAIAWNAADHDRLIIFAIVYLLAAGLMALLAVIPFRNNEVHHIPVTTMAGVFLAQSVLGMALWFDTASARNDVFAFAVGIVLYACAAGALATLGADRLLLRLALTGLLAPYCVAALVFGHVVIGLGTLFFYAVVVIVAVDRIAEGRTELVQLRLDAAERATIAERTAATDQLTGLLNRYGLAELDLGGTLSSVTALFIDLNRFKTVNDTHGHAVGDEVLRIAARRLDNASRPGDIVARLGGDEFVVIAPGLVETDAGALADAIATSLAAPMSIASAGEVTISASIGTASSAEHPIDVFTLVTQSDRAMYAAKTADRSAAALPSDQRRAELERAFARREFELWFQPIVALDDLAIVAAEGLVRWRHPTEGVLAPVHFLDDIDQAGMTGRLAEQVVEQAIEMIATASRLGHAVPISVNLTAGDLLDEGLCSAITALLDARGVSAELLSIELTEGAMLSTTGEELAMVRKLADHGIRTSLDDFGTGYSSLERLRLLPLSEVKIDRSFVQRSAEHPADRIIAQAMVDLSRHLHLAVVAEGIETEEHLALMRRMGCDLGQGWLFAKAAPGDEWLALLAEGVRDRASLTDESAVLDAPEAAIALSTEVSSLGLLIDTPEVQLELGLPTLERMPIAAFVKGPDGRFVWSNPHHTSVLGLAEGASVVELSDTDVHRYDEAIRYRQDDLRVLAEGQTIHNRYERQRKPDGTWVEVRTSKLPVHNSGGDVIGLLGFSIEVSGADAEPPVGSFPVDLFGPLGS